MLCHQSFLIEDKYRYNYKDIRNLSNDASLALYESSGKIDCFFGESWKEYLEKVYLEESSKNKFKESLMLRSRKYRRKALKIRHVNRIMHKPKQFRHANKYDYHRW